MLLVREYWSGVSVYVAADRYSADLPRAWGDAAVVSLAGACGFHYGVTTNEWHASFGDDLLKLPRLEVWGTESVAEFAAKLSP